MILLLLALAGCGDPKAVDADADGTLADADCDDADAAVNPRAAEACNGVDDNCDGVVDEGLALTEWLPDGDGDGYGSGDPVSACAAPAGTTPTGGDCDDADATRYPGAPEKCDGVDHDCDERVDEPSSTDATTVYRDADADGYGGDAQTACPGAPGTAAAGGDCDDGDPEVSPAGVEACTPAGRDEDCDGLVDDADESLAIGPSWWEDDDRDGYGAGDPAIACEAPAGSVPLAGDCDDADATAHPGAAEPDCADGLDQNCDGTLNDLDRDGDGAGACSDCDDTDDHVLPGAPEACNEADDDCNGIADDGIATSVYYADSDGDGYGDPAVTSERCGPNVDWVATGDDCDDTVSTISPGAEEQCRGNDDDDCDGEVDEENASGCRDYARDADRDGYGDAADLRCLCNAVGEYDAVASDYGWTADCDDTTLARAPNSPDTCGDGFDANCDGLDGCSVSDLPMVGHGAVSRAWWATDASAGDLTGDGVADLAVGVPGQTGDPGAVEVYAGPWTFPLTAATFTFGPDGDDALGLAVVVSDLDGDGADDFVATAPYHDDGSVYSMGAVYAVHGPLSGDGTLDAIADLTIDGAGASSVVGHAVEVSPDLDGDGATDLVIASDYAGGRGQGKVWVSPADWTGTYTDADLPVTISGTTPYASLGSAIDAGEDVDGDGAADLLVVSFDAAYVYFGPVTGAMTSVDADVTVHGEEILDYSPFHFTDDLDGDGLADVIAGAIEGVYLQTGLTPGRRASWAAWGAVFGSADYLEVPTDVVGSDVNGDGAVDLVIGTGNANVYSGYYGGAYVLLGPLEPGAHMLEDGADAGWVGDSSVGYLGSLVHPLGDVDGVAGEELLLWGWSGTGASSYAGAAWYLSAGSLP